MFFNVKGARIFCDVPLNARIYLIEGKNELHSMTEIWKLHVRNMQDKKLSGKNLSATSKEHAPLAKTEINETRNYEVVENSEVCEK